MIKLPAHFDSLTTVEFALCNLITAALNTYNVIMVLSVCVYNNIVKFLLLFQKSLR